MGSRRDRRFLGSFWVLWWGALLALSVTRGDLLAAVLDGSALATWIFFAAWAPRRLLPRAAEAEVANRRLAGLGE